MNNGEIKYIKKCIETPLKYQYSEGTYAKLLLKYGCEQKQKLSEIKQSKWGYLLNKPSIKKVVSKCGDGFLNKEYLEESWCEKTKVFSLTLSQWGILETKKKNCAYYQVSRPQKSLVLQVNFGGDHNAVFNTYFKKSTREYFTHSLHAGHQRKNTLGWIRIDLDMDKGEALIEEVQTDWMKTVFRIAKELKTKNLEHPLVKERTQACRNYINFMLKNYKGWDEILLYSAIRFLKEEIGIYNIWYHTFESGKFYKMMPDYSLPPQSLYTKLPKKMGFKKVKQIPKILAECKELKRMNNVAKNIAFYNMNLKT